MPKLDDNRLNDNRTVLFAPNALWRSCLLSCVLLLATQLSVGCFGGPIGPGGDRVDGADTGPSIALGSIDPVPDDSAANVSTDPNADDVNGSQDSLENPNDNPAAVNGNLPEPNPQNVQCNANRAYLHGDVWALRSNGNVNCDHEYKAYWRCQKRGGPCTHLKYLRDSCNLCWTVSGRGKPSACDALNESPDEPRGYDTKKMERCDKYKKYVDPACNEAVPRSTCNKGGIGDGNCMRSNDVRNYDYDNWRGYRYGSHHGYSVFWGLTVMNGDWQYGQQGTVVPGLKMGVVGDDRSLDGDRARESGSIEDSYGLFAGYELPIGQKVSIALIFGNWPAWQASNWDRPWESLDRTPWYHTMCATSGQNDAKRCFMTMDDTKFDEEVSSLISSRSGYGYFKDKGFMVKCQEVEGGGCTPVVKQSFIDAVYSEMAVEQYKAFTPEKGKHYFIDEYGFREWDDWEVGTPCAGPPQYIKEKLAHMYAVFESNTSFEGALPKLSYSTLSDDVGEAFRGLDSQNYRKMNVIRISNEEVPQNSFDSYFPQ